MAGKEENSGKKTLKTAEMSASGDFSIPLSREELLKSDGRGSYTVTEVLSPQEITSRIDGTAGEVVTILCYHHVLQQNANPCLPREVRFLLKSASMCFTVLCSEYFLNV